MPEGTLEDVCQCARRNGQGEEAPLFVLLDGNELGQGSHVIAVGRDGFMLCARLCLDKCSGEAGSYFQNVGPSSSGWQMGPHGILLLKVT